jgi:tetratricopeptide (TPR) repeat protein
MLAALPIVALIFLEFIWFTLEIFIYSIILTVFLYLVKFIILGLAGFCASRNHEMDAIGSAAISSITYLITTIIEWLIIMPIFYPGLFIYVPSFSIIQALVLGAICGLIGFFVAISPYGQYIEELLPICDWAEKIVPRQLLEIYKKEKQKNIKRGLMTSIAGIAAPILATALFLKGPKRKAIDALKKAISSTNDNEVKLHLSKAIEHIRRSLDDDLWVDDNHVDPVLGEKVFDEEKEATRNLISVNGRVNVSKEVADKSYKAIAILVEVDKKLAKTAQEEAEKIVKENQVLAECIKELGIALQNQEQGLFENAIEHYKQAWKQAKTVITKNS